MSLRNSSIAALLATASLARPVFLPGTAAFGLASPDKLSTAPGYSISVFARGVKRQYDAPDSIAVTRDRVFIGYGDDHDPTGADGKKSQIVEYTKDGRLLHIFKVRGRNDGLKPDPLTGKIWAMQNEDATPNLSIIDPRTNQQTQYTFASAPPSGGGYDDIVFRAGKVYFSASNPSRNPNAEPAIVEATFDGNTIKVSPLLKGNAKALNLITGQWVTLNLQDPDSMTLDPSGDVLLDSQGDSELIVVRRPGSKWQEAIQMPLTSPFGIPQVDDTAFAPSDDAFLLVADTPANIIYKVTRTEFLPGAGYTAAVATDSANHQVGFIGRLNLEYGQLTPVVTGLQNPHGMGFVKTHDNEPSTDDQIEDLCRQLTGN